MAPSPQPGDLTPIGTTVVRGILLTWIYTTVTKLDYIQTTNDSVDTIVANIYGDLAPHAPINKGDIEDYVNAIQSDNANHFASVAQQLVNSQAPRSITIYNAELQAAPLDGWSGGTHPRLQELTTSI